MAALQSHTAGLEDELAKALARIKELENFARVEVNVARMVLADV